MRIEKTRVAALAVVALSLAPQARAQAKAAQAGRVPSTSTSTTTTTTALAAPMPKTDRMAMADFKKVFAQGDVVIIDVRDNGSYLGSHIPGALSIPEDTITPLIAEKLKRMGKPIATYCS